MSASTCLQVLYLEAYERVYASPPTLTLSPPGSSLRDATRTQSLMGDSPAPFGVGEGTPFCTLSHRLRVYVTGTAFLGGWTHH